MADGGKDELAGLWHPVNATASMTPVLNRPMRCRGISCRTASSPKVLLRSPDNQPIATTSTMCREVSARKSTVFGTGP